MVTGAAAMLTELANTKVNPNIRSVTRAVPGPPKIAFCTSLHKTRTVLVGLLIRLDNRTVQHR